MVIEKYGTYTPTTGELHFLEREMEIQEEMAGLALASNDDELLTLISMTPDQYCSLYEK